MVILGLTMARINGIFPKIVREMLRHSGFVLALDT
jgi:hypothetical protein